MAGIRLLGIHREWEDWLGMLLGVVIGFSPWLANQQDSQVVMWNAVIIGAALIALGALEFVSLSRWQEGVEMVIGVWLIVSPFFYGYAGAGDLRYWHFGLGALVALLAAFELWQDWKLSDRELAEHGR